jgi:hypothetical protein
MMAAMWNQTLLSWMAVTGSLLLLFVYELRLHVLGRRDPSRFARHANARVRMHWVAAMSTQPGFEVVAVQALRNSLMSATISASTSALAVMATVSVAGGALAGKLSTGSPVDLLHISLQAMLLLTLFASYVCSAMAMRHYGHASFIMSMPVASAERIAFTPAAVHHVGRAGLLYSWGLRLFLMVAPLVVGVVHPLAMPLLTGLLMVALHYFDQPAQVEID